MRQKFLTAAALAAAVFFAAPIALHADPLGKSDPKEAGFSRAGLDRLSTYLKSEIAKGTMPGAVLLIEREGETAYYEGFGVRDPATKQPMTADTLFRIYSMTKPIVTVAAMMLVEEGRLGLDEPISKYIPSFKDVKVGVEKKGEDGKATLDLVAPRRPPSIQDLMRHTSGITYGFFGAGLVKQAYVDAKIFSEDADNSEFADRIAKLPLAYQPGTTWDYSHSTDILGRVVEVIAGKPQSAVLKERLFDPMGMTNTSFYVTDPAKQPLIAEPFPNDRNIGTDADVNDPRIQKKWESGGGGLVSTIGDYAKFCRMVLNDGELAGKRYLSPNIVAYMSANHLNRDAGIVPGPLYLPGPGFGFGLGFAVRTEEGVSALPGSKGELNWGGAGGTAFWIDPEEDMFVVFMAQTPSNRGRLRVALKGLIYGAIEE